ncbi:glutaredoxin family protein [Deinococcus budaensis]|uniref:Glutaredoxin n=1 Tax=Deinococcus budaensis TaxID=1665626 RepID=A0A7W8LQ50_9DEIO|nr:NrdH-redoxin [Deinococcus budaensis]MBB5234277.1 glutaredoxin [Deinococcus budaensis]
MLSTVPNGQALRRLLTQRSATVTTKNVRGDPEALAEKQAQADVRTAPVTLIGEQACSGSFDGPRPRMLAARPAVRP